MPLPGEGTTRIKRCQSIWSNHTPRSMRIRWAMVHCGGMGSPNIYTLTPPALQDHFFMQPAVFGGLLAHLTGLTFQEDIATTARRLQQLGRAILMSSPL